MDKLLESFSPSFLLRSVFSGAFFVLAYAVGKHGTSGAIRNIAEIISPAGFSCALIAGVTIYGIHRAVLFPWFEWFLNSEWAKRRRKKWWTLMSENSITNLVEVWDRRAEKGHRESYRGKQIAEWADYIHQQYVSAWCIVFGSIAAQVVEQEWLPANWPLVGIFTFLLIAALVSNWRSYSLAEHWKVVQDDNSASQDTRKEQKPSAV